MAFCFIDQVFNDLLQAYTVEELEMKQNGSLAEFQQVLKMLQVTYNYNFRRRISSLNYANDDVRTEMSMNLGDLIKKMQDKESSHFMSTDNVTESLLESVDFHFRFIIFDANYDIQFFTSQNMSNHYDI